MLCSRSQPARTLTAGETPNLQVIDSGKSVINSGRGMIDGSIEPIRECEDRLAYWTSDKCIIT